MACLCVQTCPAKGVAWSVPAIAVSSAIPAFAASGPCVDRTDNMQVLATDFPAGQTGVVGGTPTTSGILSVSASYGNVTCLTNVHNTRPTS